MWLEGSLHLRNGSRTQLESSVCMKRNKCLRIPKYTVGFFIRMRSPSILIGTTRVLYLIIFITINSLAGHLVIFSAINSLAVHLPSARVFYNIIRLTKNPLSGIALGKQIVNRMNNKKRKHRI